MRALAGPTAPATGLEELLDGLHSTPPAPFPFADFLYMRAFLLERREGNLLLYSGMRLSGAVRAIDERGGVSRQYLGHRHEAPFLPPVVSAPLFVHQDDYDPAHAAERDVWTFSREHMVGRDFQVLPVPGHTPGATAYLWEGDGHRFLFTSDTLHVRDGRWMAAVRRASDREAYLASLEMLRELDFDVLVPWIATDGEPYALTDPADARRRIDAVIERVRAGADH
jgi:glyoxylase-like metal-dependent hydrolase (beta-lactamase superfamily II)